MHVCVSCFHAVDWRMSEEVATPRSASLWLKTQVLWSSRLTFGRLQRNTNLQQRGLLKMQGTTQLQRSQLSAFYGIVIIITITTTTSHFAEIRMSACMFTTDPWKIFASTSCHIYLLQEERTALLPLHSAGSHARSPGPSPSCGSTRRRQRRVCRELARNGRPDRGSEKYFWRHWQGQHAHLVHRLVTLMNVTCVSEMRLVCPFPPYLLHDLESLCQNMAQTF